MSSGQIERFFGAFSPARRDVPEMGFLLFLPGNGKMKKTII
jgi:hypothetical protein